MKCTTSVTWTPSLTTPFPCSSRSDRSSGWTQAWAWASLAGGGHAGVQAVTHRLGSGGGRVSSRARASVAAHSGTSRPASAAADSQVSGPGDGAGPIAGLGRQVPGRSASVSSGVSCQGDGRSRSTSRRHRRTGVLQSSVRFHITVCMD